MENRNGARPSDDVRFAYDASFAQERLWFYEALDEQGSRYNSALAFRLHGRVNGDALACAVRDVVARHDALRTTFALDGHRLMQIVHESLAPRVVTVSVDQLPAAERELEAQRLARADAREPFDLVRGPLVRALVVRLGADEHLFVLTLHHIVADGASVRALLEELSATYAARAAGRAPALRPVTIQYPDFAVWQRNQLAPDVIDSHLAFWRRTLEGSTGDLSLPADGVRPPGAPRAGVHVFALPPALRRRLTELGRCEGASLFMTLLAALNMTLHRAAGDTDISIGAPIANRDQPELEQTIGFFANTVVYRTRLDDDPFVRELLHRVRDTALQVYDHQAIPFQHVVAAVRPARNAERTPLVRVMLALQPALERALALPGVHLEIIPIEPEVAKFDLQLEVQDTGDELRVTFEYAADVFDAASIAHLAALFRHTLIAVVEHPDARVSSLPLIAPDDRRRAITEWNNTRRDYPRDTPLHELVDATAVRLPHATAIECGEHRITYRDLCRRSRALARRLVALGAGPHAPVAVAADRSIEFVVAVLAAVRTGAPYVPIDPAYPPERAALMLNDVRARILLTADPSLALRSRFAGRVLDIRAATSGPIDDPDEPLPAVPADAAAYIMYTSGSTGRPKGVVVPHRAVSRLALNTTCVSLGAADVVAHVSNVSFDAATFEIWGPLLNGGRLTIIDRDTLLAPAALAHALEARQVSVMFLTTALFKQIAAQRPDAFAPLRCLIVGGEAVDPGSVRRVLEAKPPRSLVNGYGPTESTTFAAFHPIAFPAPNAIRIPIGRPIDNTTAFVLDREGEIAPVGVVGELWLGGDGIACGYLRQPERTSERFVPDRFSSDAGARLYRTGDVARYLADGSIDCLGRRDRQVKVRGFRIELEEIEAALRAQPGVQACHVMVREETAGDKQIVAYVVCADINEPATHLRSGLAGVLPSYMVPSAVVCLDALPVTPNGKVDAKALPAPGSAPAALGAPVQSPTTTLEMQIALTWERLFRRHPIGLDDDFFDLGGHSLLAATMLAQLSAACGHALPLAMLFRAPTIRSLAHALSAGDVSGTAIVPLHATRGSTPPLVLVHRAGGHLLVYRTLISHLHPDIAVYGIQAPGHEIGQPMHREIGAMASFYVEQLLETQPHGPCRLAGSSFGGIVAFEMARQLDEAGHSVDFVGLFDTYPADMVLWMKEHPYTPRPETLARRTLQRARRFARMSIAERRAYVGRNVIRIAGQAVAALHRPATNILRPAVAPPRPDPVVTAFYNAVYDFTMRPYAGRVVLFRAVDYDRHPAVPLDHGWSKWALGGVDVDPVPGTHLAMLEEPCVRAFADRLSDRLRRSRPDEELRSLAADVAEA